MMHSKKIFLLSLCMMITTIHAHKTKKLQILINPADPTFLFALNAGVPITTVPTAVRPFGSYYLMNGLIYPGDTISKTQVSFVVDKNGNPLYAANSLGFWEIASFMLAAVNPLNPPAAGTLIELSQQSFLFTNKCDGSVNVMTAAGKTVSGVAVPQQVASTSTMGVTGAFGCNNSNNSYVAKLYISADRLSFLINIKFDKEIEYN